MRILVRHGHFAFYPQGPSGIARFCKLFDVSLEREGKYDFYTFPRLSGLPDYSLVGKPFGNLPANTMYEGKPWEVMKENGYVYSLALGLLVPKQTIVGVVTIKPLGYYFSANLPILQPGLFTTTGQKIMSYDGEFNFEMQRLEIREVQFE